MARKKTTETPAAETTPPPAEYTVLARRYRPQQFGDLVGQEPVAQALTNAVKSGRIAHAYLFTGARGVGKTSAARILAKALNCERGPTVEPCDRCDMCRAIAAGDDVDVLEIDGASNRGIDEVREIRSNVQYRPQRARYKIYIIDEVHMLTTPAFNALLKTLEEPPPHVKFIFATTEVQKIPVTILSRCQRFDFAGIAAQQIIDRLREIVASEGMKADDEALELVARRAGGSMRDAQSLLDQLLAFGGDKLTVERVHELLGTAGEERVVNLAAAILRRQTKEALDILAQVVNQGQQLGELLDQLIDYWRDLMVVQTAGNDAPAVSVTRQHQAALREQAASVSLDTILAGLDVLVSTKTRMRNSIYGRVLMEMAIVRLGRLDDLMSLPQLAQFLSGQGNITPRPATAAAAAPLPPSEKKKLADEPAAASAIRLTAENLPAIWQQVVHQSGFVLGNELRGCGIAISGPNLLELTVPVRYNRPGDSLLEGDKRQRVESILADLVGREWTLEVRCGPTETAPNSEESRKNLPAPVQKARRLRGELLSYPLVQKAVDVLAAQIVHVDDEFGQAPAAPAALAPDASEDD